MNLSLAFIRTLFVLLCVFFLTVYMISGPDGHTPTNLGIGLLLGLILGGIFICFDLFVKRYHLRSFNIAIIGIFFGYLMGQALVLILGAILDISTASIRFHPQLLEILKISLFLFGIYLGTLMTLRASDELYISIPFVKFTPTTHKKRELTLDTSVLCDSRILDFASSGIIDNHVLIPRFIEKELYSLAEIGDDTMRNKAKRALEVLKKLKSIPELELRLNDTDFPEIKDPTSKLIRFARLMDANILTADMSQIQLPAIEGVRFINIHALSNSLKPIMQAGEQIKIKIQRHGKEPRQGVGYLEDGTMVVVNGGGDYIGEIVDARVLSVKHTSSGRMIFCNILDEEGYYPNYDEHEEE